jgi:hypothetical protein
VIVYVSQHLCHRFTEIEAWSVQGFQKWRIEMRYKAAVSILALAIVAGGVFSAAPAFANSTGTVHTTQCSTVYTGVEGFDANGFSAASTSRPSAGCGGGIAVQLLDTGQSTYLGITHGTNSQNFVSQDANESFFHPAANHWYLYQNANRSAGQF